MSMKSTPAVSSRSRYFDMIDNNQNFANWALKKGLNDQNQAQTQQAIMAPISMAAQLASIFGPMAMGGAGAGMGLMGGAAQGAQSAGYNYGKKGLGGGYGSM